MGILINKLEEYHEKHGLNWSISHAFDASTGKKVYRCRLWNSHTDEGKYIFPPNKIQYASEFAKEMGTAIMRTIQTFEEKYGEIK